MAKAATKKNRPAASAAAAARPDRLSWIYLLLGALAISAFTFGPALKGTFVFDDLHLPFADPHAPESPIPWIRGVRPLLMLTYWLNFRISGAGTWSYHLFNLLIHAGTSVLIFMVCERLLAIAGVASMRRGLALFGAALFLLHPLQTESVDYIAGRSELAAGLFFVAAWLIFLRHFDKPTGMLLTLEICLFGGLAVLSKESAISLPAILLLTDLYFADEPIGSRLRRRIKLYALFLIGGLAAAFLILRSLTPGSAAGFGAGISPFEYALTQCRVILTYMRLFVIPLGQNGDWQLPFYRSLGDGAAAVYALGLILLVALIVWLYKRERLVSFGLAAFLIMLAPTSSIVPVRDALTERRMYLPMAGLILALLGAASKISLTSAWRRAAAAALLLLCVTLSWQRSEVWASDFNLWSDSLHSNPINARAHLGLGTSMVLRGDCAGAVGEFSKAQAQMRPDTTGVSTAEIVWNMAAAYECDSKLDKALALYRSFAAGQPTAAAYERIGLMEAKLDHSDAAMEAFEHALKLDPGDATALAYRGIGRIALGDRQGEADLHRALELDPGNQAATAALARLAAER